MLTTESMSVNARLAPVDHHATLVQWGAVLQSGASVTAWVQPRFDASGVRAPGACSLHRCTVASCTTNNCCITVCQVTLAINGSINTPASQVDGSGATVVIEANTLTLRVASLAVHMRQGKGCAWDLEVEVLDGSSIKVGGVLGETLAWRGSKQQALGGALDSYLGDEAVGVVQWVDVPKVNAAALTIPQHAVAYD